MRRTTGQPAPVWTEHVACVDAATGACKRVPDRAQGRTAWGSTGTALTPFRSEREF